MRFPATVLAVLVLGGVAGCAGTVPGNTPRTATPGTTATATRAGSSAAVPPLGPTGFGALQLGMTKAEARATGLTTEVNLAGTGACGGPGDGYLRGSPSPDGQTLDGRLFFSANTGKLVAIYAFPGVRTPEGIALGSSYDDVHAAYPAWSPIGEDQRNGRGGVKVPGNAGAAYRIVVQNLDVIQLSLDGQQDCYE
jgi:hypothetical protein